MTVLSRTTAALLAVAAALVAVLAVPAAGAAASPATASYARGRRYPDQASAKASRHGPGGPTGDN